MITLYHSPRSRSSRMIWLLEELGAPYEIRPVSIFRPLTGEGAPDPANPHPDARVPAIENDGVLVAESIAIVLYLADAFPTARLAPAPGDKRRGEYLTWLAWYAAEMEPAMKAGLMDEIAASPLRQRDHAAVVRRVEAALARGSWMMGEDFTTADILVESALAFGRKAFPESQAIDAYIQRCQARPAAIRAAALDEAQGIQKAA